MINTLITNAFNQSIFYWRSNPDAGTKRGLIKHLQSSVGISEDTATSWVNAMATQAFTQALTDSPDYAAFKNRLVAVGADRALAGVKSVFDNLRTEVFAQEANNEILSQIDEKINMIIIKLAKTNSVITELTEQPPSSLRDESLSALSAQVLEFNQMLGALQAQRDQTVGTI